MYIVEQNQIDNIYEQIKHLEIYSFEGDSIINPALDIGDLLLIDDKYVIYQGSLEYQGKFKANISSKIQCKGKEDTTSRIPSQKIINRRVQSQIDQAEGIITQLVQETSDYEDRFTKQEQDIDNIRQKVSNTINYKREVEGVTEIYLDNAMQKYALKIEVKGNKTYEDNLYPKASLYPKSNLYPNQKGGE